MIRGFPLRGGDLPLRTSRALAFVFAVGLAIGEALINWGHWQFAPLWVVDYLIVAWLIFAGSRARSRMGPFLLGTGWAFAAGVFYMALFVSISPGIPRAAPTPRFLLVAMGAMLLVTFVGLFCAALAARKAPNLFR